MQELLARVPDVDEEFLHDLRLALRYDRLTETGREIIDDLTAEKARVSVLPADVRCSRIKCLRINRVPRAPVAS